jgi:SAM-dependent methyltransferase
MDLSELGQKDAPRHPWEVSRARAIERLVQNHGPSQPADILDYGCGDGFTGRRLFEKFRSRRYVGFDAHLSAKQCAAWSSSDGRLSFVNTAPPAAERFDLVLLCDVIEHVEDPRFLLGEAALRVREGGAMIVTVPAFQALFSEHDRALKHFRRYSLAELLAVLKEARLEVGPSGYLFGSLLVPRALAVARENLRGASPQGTADQLGIGAWKGNPLLTRFITAFLDFDNNTMRLLATAGLKAPGLTAWTVLHRMAGQP